MKTDELIGSLVADQGHPPESSRRVGAFALPLALLLAIGVFVVLLDIRPDFTDAVTSWRYLLKIALAASIALSGIMLLFRIARPEQAPAQTIKWVLIALIPLGLGVLGEAMLLPVDQWKASAMGFQFIYCLTLVPLISLAPLVATLVTLRRGAPQSPMAAGAIAGFAAGGIGAVIYALHCNNDSPFYVAIWYLGAIGIVTLVGAGIGRFWLRW